MTAYRSIRVDVRPTVVRVALHRPALDGVVLAEVRDALEVAEATPDCRVLALRGTDGVFCTGLDLAAAAGSDPTHTRRAAEEFYALLHRFTTTRLIVVSTVDGATSGGGVGLVAASDLVFATPRSTFGLPELLWGLLPCTVLPFLIRRVGYHHAATMTLTTAPLDATRAERNGLVDQVHATPEAALRPLLPRLSRLDRTAVATAKSYLDRLHPIPAESRALAVDEFTRLAGDPGVRQRIAAFTSQQKLPWEE